MRLGLTTEGAETPVRAARKEVCERIRFVQSDHSSPTLNGRQMICGRGVDEWHGIPLFAIIHPCPAERVSVVSVVDGPSVRLIFSLAFLTGAPSARAEHQQLGPPGTNGLYTFCLHPLLRGCDFNSLKNL